MTLDAVPPSNLSDTRQQLHWSLQPLASVSFALAEPAANDTHANVLWRQRAFHGRTLPGGHHLGMDPVRWTLGFFDASDAPIESLSLPGRTLESVHSWITTRLKVRGHILPEGLSTPPYGAPEDIPPQDVLFSTIEHAETFADWYDLATSVLTEVTASLDDASEIQGRPEHFDLSTQLSLGKGSLTLGFSPGDAAYDQPYFYATPHPRPETPGDLPSLPHGAEWHDGDFFGAVLTAQALLDADTTPALATHQVLQAALVAATTMLG